MKMFYFDDKIYAFEKNAAFNDCLRYLENLFAVFGKLILKNRGVERA